MSGTCIVVVVGGREAVEDMETVQTLALCSFQTISDPGKVSTMREVG